MGWTVPEETNFVNEAQKILKDYSKSTKDKIKGLYGTLIIEQFKQSVSLSLKWLNWKKIKKKEDSLKQTPTESQSQVNTSSSFFSSISSLLPSNSSTADQQKKEESDYILYKNPFDKFIIRVSLELYSYFLCRYVL